ncbi:hypothetical protein [Lentibacillus salicampi]|uniref:DUF3937 domain-containing protein n=1 Tax=Lentibacillus salicampi TaxID=175306 RepID=A0A4Y9A8S1_9BACI|nr:hypothetical protein [Lentibacillus salicampi]TFJ91825.1 hypothetical protein E4U82_15730 [Lentibacillus salicampi]
MEKLSKVLFWGGIAYFVIIALTNLDSTFHLNATQYVPEGEDPDPLRITEVINDVVYPAYNALILIALSYITKCFSKEEA